MKIGVQSWGSEGDIRPLLALAGGLRAAGHQVSMAVTDVNNKDHGPTAQRLGVSLRAVGMPVLDSAQRHDQLGRAIIKQKNPLKQAQQVMEHLFNPVLEPMCQAADILCAENDLVIGHYFLYPLQAYAAHQGTPVATVTLTHSMIPSRQVTPHGLPNIGSWANPFWWWLTGKVLNRLFLRDANALRNRLHLPAARDLLTDGWFSPRLNLVAVSGAIAEPQPDWSRNHQVCGFLNLPAAKQPELEPPLREFLTAGPPPVFMTFGSLMPGQDAAIAETVALWREAAELVGCRAILQVPETYSGPMEASDRVMCTRAVAHERVFPHCAAVVHHGGAGTTQATLRAGVPSVVVAHVSDQFFWAGELHRLGVAAKGLVRPDLTAAALAARLKSVLAAPQMRRRAEALGETMAREHGVANAVRLIEGLGPAPETGP